MKRADDNTNAGANAAALDLPVPGYEEHRRAWEELAWSIANLRDTVNEASDTVPPAQRPGELTIIGSGIETVGFSVGDQRLIESADKVLYCVADPATIVWIRRLRPDALDLYVLYGDDKIRYTTYMQMAEAQLYWVRQGLKVVVIFYGHPGIFVLSTHRAVLIARREGHRAVMKAGVSALDTLCADLGVDPSHPGLQTHEATDALTRRRRLDTSLHVVLWQVGLIGELGYRRQGYLNANFSYFVRWLQEIYGPDYPVTHYIGSRYPSIDPLVETQPLSALHDPEAQARITGLSTFYLAPRDVVPTDAATARELGLVREGDRLVTPASALRDIGRYGPREKAAFRAFRRFAIPSSYRWQEDTAASDFLIALRFDPELQERYRRDPLAALSDERFAALSDRDRALLASRDPGAIQIAAKGAYRRSSSNERLITELLNSRTVAAELMLRVADRLGTARAAVQRWLGARGTVPDRAQFTASVDWIYRNAAFPWTGVYVDDAARRLVVWLGHRANRRESLLYVDGRRIPRFQFADGVIRWRAGGDVPHSGVLRLDPQPSGRRRMLGKTWTEGLGPASAATFIAEEADPGSPALGACPVRGDDLASVEGEYALRSSGRFAREVMRLRIAANGVSLGGVPVGRAALASGRLRWSGGTKDWFQGELGFLSDPVTGSLELFGQCRSLHEPAPLHCYGARLLAGSPTPAPLPVPAWARGELAALASGAAPRGGLLLWHKWEKAAFTNRALTSVLVPLI